MTSITAHDDFATALLVPRLAVPKGLKAANARETAHRFAIHRNNVVVSLVDALAESFPVCRALVGDVFFRAMARERVLGDPPRSPVLFEYTEGFADFIAGFAPAASVPYLADVARVEALRVRAWHAADAEPITETAYRELAASPQRLAATCVVLHPACGWLRCAHAAHAIWSAHEGIDDLSDATLEGIDTSDAEDVLVMRPQLQVGVVALPHGAVEFLDALKLGELMGKAFEIAAESQPDVDTSALFTVLVRHGLVVACDTELEH